MSIKTLLVHLAPDDDCEGRLSAAVSMAKGMQAHLIALYVATPVHLPAGAEGRGASAVFLSEARESARKKSVTIKEMAEAACKEAGVDWSWAYGEEDHLDAILEEVHHADMTIVNQVSFDHFEDRLMFQMPEKLVIGAGGPVLVLPKGGKAVDLVGLDTVLVAWTYSKEAIRALRDALPVLQSAKSVKLLTCGKGHQGDETATPVIEYLKRHGIESEAVHHSSDGHAGEEILDVAETFHANLIVMGAYGHTSFIDKLFGSASRYVIGHTHIPLFLSH